MLAKTKGKWKQGKIKTAYLIALAVFFLGSIALFTGFPYILGAVSFAMGTVLIGFELFVAVLQAFIFSVLSASYIAGAMATEH